MNKILFDYFKDKKILVTGGTGSFGHYIISELVKLRPAKVIIFSNDEDQQYHAKEIFKDYDFLEFMLGDVRDYQRIFEATTGVDIVYHAAALKHVPMTEFHPFEAVETNVVGAENVRRASVFNNVKTVVTISTDKAVKPVNVMGMTKAIQERIMLNPINEKHNTKFVCVRYGNVIGSRGSVIPFFKDLIKRGKPLPVTSFEMTRFLLKLSQAIELVFKATVDSESGQLLVRKMPACRILDLAKVMGKIIGGKDNYPINEVGIRPGEKIHEVLVSEEEMRRAVEMEDYYIIHPYPASEIVKPASDLKEYASDSNKLMTEEEITLLLKEEI